MPSGKSIESVQIEALTKQTDRLHLVVEKVAEGMAALLETTAANNVKHDDAEEFKKEAKEMFKQVAVNIKEVWAAIEKVKESIKELENQCSGIRWSVTLSPGSQCSESVL